MGVMTKAKDTVGRKKKKGRTRKWLFSVRQLCTRSAGCKPLLVLLCNVTVSCQAADITSSEQMICRGLHQKGPFCLWRSDMFSRIFYSNPIENSRKVQYRKNNEACRYLVAILFLITKLLFLWLFLKVLGVAIPLYKNDAKAVGLGEGSIPFGRKWVQTL